MKAKQHGRYTLTNEIGAGGFAAVYQATDTALDREVAVKIMRPLLMSDAEFVMRFQREAKVAANLQHANIVPIYDYGEHNGRLFIAMKLMQSSIAARLEQGAIPWEQVVPLMQQVAAGLDFAHQRGMIHRDIKPDNILLDENGDALLADFGIVKAMGQSTITISMSGGILGTPAYVPPEVWNDQPTTAATDVYALACVLYEMVMGQKLFEASTPPATMALHFRDLQLPANWPDGVPPGLSDVLRHALAQEPADRIQTAGELANAVAALTLDPFADQYAALQAALTAEKWTDAIALAEAILAQDAAYKETPALLRQATAGQMAAQQAIQAAQWREQAEQAVAAGNWKMALTAIQRWQQTAPDDPAAQQLLAEVQAEQNKAAVPLPPPKQVESQKEKTAVPGWVWFVAGTVVIALLFFGSSQLFDNSVIVERTATSVAEVAMTTDTPSATVTDAPTKTSTPKPADTLRPTSIQTPTILPSKTPTNTPQPTSTFTKTPTSEVSINPTVEPQARVVSSVNVRSGPGTEYPVVRVAQKDDVVSVIAKNNDASWYNIVFEDKSLGWIFASYTEPINASALSSVSLAVTIPSIPISTQTSSSNLSLSDCQLNMITPGMGSTITRHQNGGTAIVFRWRLNQELPSGYYFEFNLKHIRSSVNSGASGVIFTETTPSSTITIDLPVNEQNVGQWKVDIDLINSNGQSVQCDDANSTPISLFYWDPFS